MLWRQWLMGRRFPAESHFQPLRLQSWSDTVRWWFPWRILIAFEPYFISSLPWAAVLTVIRMFQPVRVWHISAKVVEKKPQKATNATIKICQDETFSRVKSNRMKKLLLLPHRYLYVSLMGSRARFSKGVWDRPLIRDKCCWAEVSREAVLCFIWSSSHTQCIMDI